MAEVSRNIGSIDCPVCGETMPVRKNGRDTLNLSCPWCGASSYAKGGSEAHRIVSSWLAKPSAAMEPAPVAGPVLAKPADKKPAAMPWEL